MTSSPERQVAVCRELTKAFEEVVRGTPAEVLARFREPPKGEITVVLSPAAIAASDAQADEAAAAVAELVAAGLSRRDAAELVSRLTSIPRGRLYAPLSLMYSGIDNVRSSRYGGAVVNFANKERSMRRLAVVAAAFAALALAASRPRVDVACLGRRARAVRLRRRPVRGRPAQGHRRGGRARGGGAGACVRRRQLRGHGRRRTERS